VRVPGELQVDRKSGASSAKSGSWASRITARRRERLAGSSQVGRSAEHIIHTGEPETRAIALDCLRLVRQHVNVFGLERVGYMLGVGIRIVISHDRPEAVGRSHLAQKASAWFSRECRRPGMTTPAQGTETKSPVRTIRSGRRPFTSGMAARRG
jgi:hypothetical protein